MLRIYHYLTCDFHQSPVQLLFPCSISSCIFDVIGFHRLANSGCVVANVSRNGGSSRPCNATTTTTLTLPLQKKGTVRLLKLCAFN